MTVQQLIGDEALLPMIAALQATITDEAEPQPVWLMDDSIAASLKCEACRGIAARQIDRATKTIWLAMGVALPMASCCSNRRQARAGFPCQVATTPVPCATSRMPLLFESFRAGPAYRPDRGGFIDLYCLFAVNRGAKVHHRGSAASPHAGCRERSRVLHDAMRQPASNCSWCWRRIDRSRRRPPVGRPEDCRRFHCGRIGAAPDTRLAEAAGLAVDNGIAVDATLQTSDPDIYAAVTAAPSPCARGRSASPLKLGATHRPKAGWRRKHAGSDEP